MKLNDENRAYTYFFQTFPIRTVIFTFLVFILVFTILTYLLQYKGYIEVFRVVSKFSVFLWKDKSIRIDWSNTRLWKEKNYPSDNWTKP